MSSSQTPGPSPSLPPASAPPVSTPIRESQPLRRRWLRGLLLLMVLAGCGGLAWWWLRVRVEVATDNAYVVGNITPIAAEVSGQVVALFIDDNTIVQPGDPIAQIDPVPFQYQVDQAPSDFGQASAAGRRAPTSRPHRLLPSPPLP